MYIVVCVLVCAFLCAFYELDWAGAHHCQAVMVIQDRHWSPKTVVSSCDASQGNRNLAV